MAQMNKEQWDKSMGQELEMIKISSDENPELQKYQKFHYLLLESVNIYACPLYIYIYAYLLLPGSRLRLSCLPSSASFRPMCLQSFSNITS